MTKHHIILIAFFLLCVTPSFCEQRFPPPDFESGYSQPPLTFQEEHTGGQQYIDVAFLAFALIAASWILHKQRSRRGLFILGLLCLLYLGFYKEGCICAIGSIQNVALAMISNDYAASLPVVAVFILPLVFALLYGRVFCGAVCPLGAIQDIFLFKALKVPLWLEKPLGLLRYFYLGLAVFFVIEHNRFIICEYDPFVSMFRFSGPMWRFLLGASLLLLGLFIARPYCRYFCPYGALLSLLSRWTSVPVKITPDECINCTLCDEVCPFGAIHRPQEASSTSPVMLRFIIAMSLLTPIILATSGLYALDGSIAGLLLGLWFGLIISSALIRLTYNGKRTEYEANQASCMSCGRCYKWCPHERTRLEAEGKHFE